MQETYDKKANVFCKVRMLNGKRLTYQFPNDLRKAMLQSYKVKQSCTQDR